MNLSNLNNYYLKNGAVLVKNFLNNDNLELVKSAINFCQEKPGPFSSKISDKKNKGNVTFSYKNNLTF